MFLLPGPVGTPNGVLAPPDLLDALDALARRTAQPLESPLLLNASYRAVAGDGLVDFEANFQVYCPKEGPLDYLLPLGSSELREARIDGKTAYPQAAANGKTGYLFTLQGKGSHQLQLMFSVRISATGSERDVKLTIPETPAAVLDFHGSKDSLRLQAVLARGAQQIIVVPDGLRLQADLGHIPTLQVRGPPPLSRTMLRRCRSRKCICGTSELRWAGSWAC